MTTKIMPITDLRRDTSAVIRGIQENGDIVYITQHGRPTVVVVDYAVYESLRACAEAQEKPKALWPPNYFEETFGCLSDDPIEREDQGSYEQREPIL